MANDSILLIKNIQEVLSYLKNDYKQFEPVLDLIATEISKTPKHIDSYVAFINNQLSTAETRKTGLIMLRTFIPFGCTEIFEEEANGWLNNSLKNCKNETVLSAEAFQIIKPLLQICAASPDLNRNVTSGTLNKIIENITKINYNNDDCIYALKCLDTCLRTYSGSSVPYKDSIKSYILSFVDCESTKLVHLAGKCFLSLQQIGGGGTKGINYKDSWKTSQLSICNTIHSLMDELFESIMELRHSEIDNSVPLLLPTLPPGDNKNKFTLQRIVNLSIFLQEMLLGAFPVAKSVHPNLILDMVNRGLSITKSTLSGQTFNDAINLYSNLFVIHKSLLKLLQSLIVCLGCDLIPYATLICKLIINNLKSTKPKDADQIKRFCDLRTVSYQTLSLWITTTKAASCVHLFSDSIIPLITNDITPQTTELNLTITQNGSSKNLSKKAKRKLQQDQISQSGIAKNYSPINRKSIVSSNNYQEKICFDALDILKIILINCGCLLKPAIHKQLQIFVVKTLSNCLTGEIPSPYDNIKCRVALYKILSTLISSKHWNMSSPIEYAVNILSKSQMDDNSDIALVSSTALSVINNIIHPQYATLQFPLNIENVTKELDVQPEKNKFPVFINEKQNEMEEIEKNNEPNNKEITIESENKSEIVTEPISNENNENEMEEIEKNNDEEIIVVSENKSEIVTEPNSNEIIEIEMTEKDLNETENVEEISDDEVVEPLFVEDEQDADAIIVTIDPITENTIPEEKNTVKPEEKTKESTSMDLDEAEMLKSFVDIVN